MSTADKTTPTATLGAPKIVDKISGRKRRASTDYGSTDSKEQIADAVREIHQSAVKTGHIDPTVFENDEAKFVFHGTEDELCSLIKDVVLKDEDTLAYAKKTDVMLNTWAEALKKEEGLICL